MGDEVFRSAVTGQFVSKEEAEANPRETYRDTMPSEDGVIAYAIETEEGFLDVRFCDRVRETVEPYLGEGEKIVKVRVTRMEE